MNKLMTMTYSMTMFTIIEDQNDDCYYITINLGQGYGHNCELDHLQVVDRDWDYDNVHKMIIIVMVILTYRGPYDHIKNISGKLVR